jgi:ribosomal protein S13
MKTELENQIDKINHALEEARFRQLHDHELAWLHDAIKELYKISDNLEIKVNEQSGLVKSARRR